MERDQIFGKKKFQKNWKFVCGKNFNDLFRTAEWYHLLLWLSETELHLGHRAKRGR